jgi:hypothetical protein
MNTKIKMLCVIVAISTLFLMSCSQETISSSQSKRYSKNEIEKIARAITVKIEWSYSNSGFIVDKQKISNGYKYTVLTSRHAVHKKPPISIDVEGLPPEEAKKLGNVFDGKVSGGKYKITVIDANNKFNEYTIKNYDEQIFLDDKLDIAVIIFESSKEYLIANLSPQISKDSLSYIYGFKNCFNEKNTVKTKEFNEGRIIEIASGSSDNRKYKVEYSNLSILGMSGSPVLNDNGQVIAIHGKRKKDNEWKGAEGVNSILRDCIAIPSNFQPNQGISIKDVQNSSLAAKHRLNFIK